MPFPANIRQIRPIWAFGALAILIGSATLAYAQIVSSVAPASRTRLEFHHQEVPTSTLVTTLNDLDGQGWEIFQVVPVWTFQKDNDDQTRLVAHAYQVFGRRSARPPAK